EAVRVGEARENAARGKGDAARDVDVRSDREVNMRRGHVVGDMDIATHIRITVGKGQVHGAADRPSVVGHAGAGKGHTHHERAATGPTVGGKGSGRPGARTAVINRKGRIHAPRRDRYRNGNTTHSPRIRHEVGAYGRHPP